MARCYPSRLPEVRKRIAQAYYAYVRENGTHGAALAMRTRFGVSQKVLYDILKEEADAASIQISTQLQMEDR